jgi:hypothetical protein
MNYLTIINAFWDWATTNPLSTGQVSLYFALLHVCNKSNWTEWFQAPNQVLSVLTGLSRSGILKARNELKQKGLIDFKERGTKATLYKLIIANSKQKSTQDSTQAEKTIANSTQESKQESTQDSTQAERTIANSTQDSKQESKQDSTQVGKQVGVQNSTPLDKQKHKQKQNKKDKPPISPIGQLGVFLSAYPKASNRFLTEREYAALLLTGAVTEERLVKCAQNYADSCRILGTPREYIKNAENFLRDFVFEQYLPENYEKPVPPKSKNAFQNFTQSTISYDDLMQKKLKARMMEEGSG